MISLLVVDDHASNRDFLVTLLGYAGYQVMAATNGAEALAYVRQHQPGLVICDILMPGMDGYEFVRRVRCEPDIAATKIIFYTAHFQEREAEQLAAAGGVLHVLMKPADPQTILDLVQRTLAQPIPYGIAVSEGFERDHVRLLSDKLAGTTEQLAHANAQLSKLVELNLQLASEHEPEMLLRKVCEGARVLLGAQHAMLHVIELRGDEKPHIAVSGFAVKHEANMLERPPADSVLRMVHDERHIERQRVSAERRALVGLPYGYPEFNCFLAAPIVSLTRRYGWICVTDKQGADEFSENDAELLAILAAQVGRIYENGSLYRRVSDHAIGLEHEVARRKRAEDLLAAQNAVSRVLAEMNSETATTFLLLRTLCEKLDFSTAALWEVDAGIGSLRKLSSWPDEDGWLAIVHDPRSSIAGRVWREGAPLWVADVSAVENTSRVDPINGAEQGAALAFPIYLHGTLTGVIELRSKLVREFDDEIVESCKAIGTQIAQFLERSAQHRNIERLNRIHAVLSGINSAIVRLHDRKSLFDEACRIAVDLGGFGVAWIGEVMDDGGALHGAAKAGLSADEIADVEILEKNDALANGGIISRAISQGKVAYSNDVLAESSTTTRRYSIAFKHGYRSVVALPFIVDERAVGCLALFAREAEFFTEDELRLLEELANDIAFALRFIDNRDQLAYLAQNDALTGLLNRDSFLALLGVLVQSAARHGGKVAVVAGNLRRFRYINESLGRQVGDSLLVELAGRLRLCWPEPEYLARVGADSFFGALTVFEDVEDVAHIVEARLQGPFSQPFLLDGQTIGIGFTLGIAVYPLDTQDPETLFRYAEAALNASRAAGDRYRFYQANMTARIAESLRRESRLRQALDAEQFVLHYQPKVDVVSRKVQGFEALLRWQDPSSGLVPPSDFIPILEDSGMIIDVGFWVMCRALEDYRRWRERESHAARIAVNVSARQLQQPNFIDTVRQALRAYGGGSAVLDIEITESMIMGNIDTAIQKLAALRDMGIDIFIDDFGTGYSSLAYLARLPVNALKIDRSFISTMTNSPESMSIVSTTISLAHSLNLKVIAEGVETEEQAKLLRLLRCDQMQGYLISKPRPENELNEFLR